MLTIVIPTYNCENDLAHMLEPLISDAVRGAIGDVIVFDDGSTDATCDIARRTGCTLLEKGEGASLPDVIDSARGDWLLFLAPGTRFVDGWDDDVGDYINSPTGSKGAAEFSIARPSHGSFWQRVFGSPGKLKPFQRGFLISKRQAKANAKPGQGMEDVMRGLAIKRLEAEVKPRVRS